MYWAKKILEWTASPQEALAHGIKLNDRLLCFLCTPQLTFSPFYTASRFSLDGRDANGYVGLAWAMLGIHDMGWAERPIFGKIRYMNYEGCRRKFDVPAFEGRYGQSSANKAKNFFAVKGSKDAAH